MKRNKMNYFKIIMACNCGLGVNYNIVDTLYHSDMLLFEIVFLYNKP